MAQLDIWNPVTTPADIRDAILVELAESPGEWHCVGPAADLDSWRAHCEAGRWLAFSFAVEDGLLFGRFVGTTIVAAKKKLNGKGGWTVDIMRRQGR